MLNLLLLVTGIIADKIIESVPKNFLSVLVPETEFVAVLYKDVRGTPLQVHDYATVIRNFIKTE